MPAISAILRYGICLALFAAAIAVLIFSGEKTIGILLAIAAALTSRVLIIDVDRAQAPADESSH